MGVPPPPSHDNPLHSGTRLDEDGAEKNILRRLFLPSRMGASHRTVGSNADDKRYLGILV